MVKKDRRQINSADMVNPRAGEWFVFGRVGSGKNTYIGTFATASTEERIKKAYNKIQHMMQNTYTADDIKKEMRQEKFL